MRIGAGPTATTGCLVGIDIGGTKTHVRVRRAAGTDQDLVVPSERWRRGPLTGRDNARRLRAVVDEVIGADRVCALVAGVHDCDTAEQCARFRRLLGAEWSLVEHLDVVNDAQLVAPASGRPDSLAIILGTGSIVVGRDSTGSPVLAGGHGWLLGDPGSAPGLVREAVRAVLFARDAGEAPHDVLATLLTAHFVVEDAADLGYALSARPDLHRWAEAAPVVFDAAERGSRLAAQVVDSAAAAIATQVHQAVSRGAVPDSVVCAGGVVTHQPLLYDRIVARLADVVPTAEVSLLRGDPVRGAIVLASRLAG